MAWPSVGWMRGQDHRILRISKCVSILTQAISRLSPHQVCSKEEVKAGFGYLVPLTLILTRILLTGKSTSRRAQLLVKKFGRGDVMKPQHHSDLKDQLRSRSPSRKETLMEFKRKEIFSLPALCSSRLLSNLLPKPHWIHYLYVNFRDGKVVRQLQ